MAQEYATLCWERLDPGNPEALVKHSGVFVISRIQFEFPLPRSGQETEQLGKMQVPRFQAVTGSTLVMLLK